MALLRKPDFVIAIAARFFRRKYAWCKKSRLYFYYSIIVVAASKEKSS